MNNTLALQLDANNEVVVVYGENTAEAKEAASLAVTASTNSSAAAEIAAAAVWLAFHPRTPFNTKAELTAALAATPADEYRVVLSDESENSQPTIYQKSGEVWVLRGRFASPTLVPSITFGQTEGTDIATFLNGVVIPVLGTPVRSNTTSDGADSFRMVGKGFPPGIMGGRYRRDDTGYLNVQVGDQLAYFDFRAGVWNSDHTQYLLYNAGSLDVRVDPAWPMADGSTPATRMRLVTSGGGPSANANRIIEMNPYGGLEIGALNGEGGGQTYDNPSPFGFPKLWVSAALNDYAAVIAGGYRGGAGYALRLHTVQNRASDYPLVISHAGGLTGAITAKGWIGLGGATPHVPTGMLDLTADVPNDYAFKFKSAPSSGTAYGPVFDISQTTNTALIFALRSGGVVHSVFTGARRMGIDVTAPVCSLDVNGPIRSRPFTFGTRPNATLGAGMHIYLTDRAGRPCYSDGTDWRWFADDAIIS